MINEALKALQKYYGYKDFRKSQKSVIENILSGKDTLAIMPTGGGKSICYQIPALLFDGITIVVSPLISLMKDQVDSIKELGIGAGYINSSLTPKESFDIISRLQGQSIKILYVAPERLESTEFCQMMKNLDISQIAVDEAHCVSQWGHDFRTSYRYISKFIKALPKRPIVTAFTATATEEVREDIVKLIQLNNPGVFISGFDRENLKINCLKEGDRFGYLLNYVKENREQSGIIYASTRKEVDNIYEKLKKEGLSVSRYHAGLSDEERKNNQEDFVYDRINVIIATNAFGMGIDKSNVRYVIHFNMPRNIEAYYQEIGRAGRDGEISECILLFSAQDIITQKYLIETSIQSSERKINEYKKLQFMIDFVHYNGCLRKYILNYFGESIEYEECGNCSNCINEGQLVDKTIDAQKVISCIYRMKKDFGVNMIADVLRASKQQKILQHKFNELSTYGIMKDYSKDDLVGFINTLIAHAYIALKEGEFPTVILNSMSTRVLKGEEKVILKEIIKVKKISSNNELFEELRILRREIAAEEGVPPYYIFADTTLKEMSTRYPLTEEQLLDISGVGESKLEKFGSKFIEIIEKYVIDKNIEISWIFKKKTKLQIDGEKVKTHEISVNMLREGKSIKEIAKERECTVQTIINHIAKFLDEGKSLDTTIKFDELFDEEQEKLVLSVVEQVGAERLAPIKEKLPEGFTYDTIRAVILKNYVLA
ncbi:MAG: DNA helicase RecQ [Bacillota bacterium]|nr:DNA helicase RecQ [Bacillota bacterium]